MILGLDELQILGQQEVILQFARRSHRDRAKPGELASPFRPHPFGKVGRDRSTASPQLAGQPIEFFSWECGRDLIHRQRQLVRLLPDLSSWKSFIRAAWIPSALCSMMLL